MEYSLTKVKGQKRITLSVKPDGSVSVRAPYRTPKPIIDAFVAKNSKWIEDRKSKLISLSNDSKLGEITIKLQPENVKKTKTQYDHLRRELTLVYPVHHSTELLAKEVEGFLIKKSKSIYEPLVRELSKQTNKEVNKVYIKTATSRWGSCSSKKNINISAYAFCLSQNLQHYIISHEVAHLTHMNHSKDFWKLVGALHPSYKMSKKELKTYSNLLGCL